MNAGENQIVVYQPDESVRFDVRTEIIPELLASIHKAILERWEYGKGKPPRKMRKGAGK